MRLSALIARLVAMQAEHDEDLFVYMNPGLEGEDENFDVSHFDAEEEEGLDERIVLW